MNANGRNHYEDWDLFALGVLDDQEERDMSAHLSSGCEDCARLYLAAKALLAGMATLSPDEPLPPGAEMRMRTRMGVAGPPATFNPHLSLEPEGGNSGRLCLGRCPPLAWSE